MRLKIPLLLAAALVGVASASAQTYFADSFDTNPVLSPTQAPLTWYPDRFRPAAFDSFNPGSGNHLRISISAADGLINRGAPYNSTFYNTQGRKFDLNNGTYTGLRGKLYVAADWATELRRSDMWATVVNGSNSVVGYPIIGIANIDRTTLMCRVWDGLNWVNVSAQVPGGVTANRWYSFEMRLKPGAIEYFVDNTLVYTFPISGGVEINDVMLQAYNFNQDPSLPVPTSGESYDAFWDDFAAFPIANNGFPVDLNGSYRASSSGPMNPLGPSSQSGLGVAATIPIGFGQVFERSGANVLAENALNGSFTPFNDATKVPNALGLATADDGDGTTFEADVDLSGTWKPFQWGQGIGNVPPFATGDTFAVGMINSFNSFGVQIVTNLSGQYVARVASTRIATGSIAALETNGTPATFPVGTTKVRLQGSVNGGLFNGKAIPLDGPNAFMVYDLGTTNGLNMNTNVPWALTYNNIGFVAGFETHEHDAAGANATVTNFATNAIPNAMYLFADDPYVRTADGRIDYRVGQANLLQAITGFQAFMNAQAGQTFHSGAYTTLYNTFNPATITAALDAAGAGTVANTANATAATLRFTPGGPEAATGTGFRPNTGTSVNLFAGGPPNFDDVVATTAASNTVLIDNTAPTLSAPVLSGSSWVSPNAIIGTLVITINASDLGAQQSGLDGRPAGQITWSNATTSPLTTTSLSANGFQTSIPITASTPNGTATLSLTVLDRAGNATTQTLTFNVSTVNISLVINEIGVTANVSRAINITVGGTGGTNAPILVRKLVNFNTGVVIGPDPARQGTTLITYQDLDLGDDNIQNNSVPPAAALTRVYAKDPFFSLGKQENLTGTLGNLSSTISLRMGDVTDNNIVNVSDLAVWAANNGNSQNPNTTLAQAPTPRQANLDGAGTVNLFDRNLIVSSWLFAGDSLVGNYRNNPRDGRQTVLEVFQETGLPKPVVISMDLDKDGWITREEVLQWRPSSGGR